MTKYIFLKCFLISSLMVLGMLATSSLSAQVTAVGQVWQYSLQIKGCTGSGQPRAYMWIPPNCSKLRGMVLPQNNMEEFSVVENQQFRDSMASINFGIIWISPAFEFLYNVQEGARETFLQMMADLASLSGYGELKNVPCVPMGHSASANFPFAFTAGTPERTLCGVSMSGIFPYDYSNLFATNYQCGTTSDYIPQLISNGEYEGAGDMTSTSTTVFNRRSAHPLTPITHLPCSGEFHFATSQRKTNFIAYYIKKIAAARLVANATDTSLATLKPIDPTVTGWLVDRWRKNMRPRYPRAPVASYTGKKALVGTKGEENFWCLDEEMATKIEDFENLYFRKAPTLVMYNQSTVGGVVGPQVPQNNNHVQCHLNFIPLNDSLDFELSASFADTIPAMSGRCAGWMATTDTVTGNWTNGKVGAPVAHPADNKKCEIIREIGPMSMIRKDTTTGIYTFRMTLERGLNPLVTNYNGTAIFSLTHPGDATFKASVLQAEIGISVQNTTGLVQTIKFDQLANVPSTTTSIPLSATSNLGLPVQYFVKEGPAQLVGSNLVFTAIPPSTKFPMKVTVVAWQWGRDGVLAPYTAGKAVPYPGQLIQTATPIENTFYITGSNLPVKLADFTGKLVGSRVELDWKTAIELNASSFGVEKSSDAQSWGLVATVAAKGTPSAYQMFDNAPQDGVNYYRLKMIDKDGSYQYSKVVSVFASITNLKISKIGNLVNVTGGRANAPISIAVYNNLGQIMLVNQQRIPASQVVSTYLTNLSSGVYIIHAASQEFVRNLKVIVQ
ncbi:T9SS type A sorting domain-containing protein [Parasediminibacterium sp. JCM 36343]|uniref:T9SS type A sorting domain-containing protein n=1 Tax=Parasediminibacterium sp. JCM 36343 TaxID=3374279 RepID=UPI003979D337